MIKKREARFLLCIVFFAPYVLFVQMLGSVRLWEDAQIYFSYAINLLHTGIYGSVSGVPDMNREPGYGFFLALALKTLKLTHWIDDYSQGGTSPGIFGLTAIQTGLFFVAAYLAAFRTLLPQKTRWPFFLLMLFSPTFVACQREIYSEALSVPLSLFLFFSFSKSIEGSSQKKSVFYFALCGICWAAIILTKAYLHFLTFCFIPLSFSAYYFSRHSKPFFKKPAIALAVMALTALAAQKIWDHRNFSQFNGDLAVMRGANAIAGKVARLDQSDLFSHLDIAFAASLGTNFCDHHYSLAQCKPFNYLGCDAIGLSVWKEYTAKYPTKKMAADAITRDMFKLYFKKPLVQIAGTILELIRMVFFEAGETFDRLPSIFNRMLPAWHIVGSLIYLAFASAGLRLFTKKSRGIRVEAPNLWVLYLFSLVIISFHFVFMSEFTNVARYIFPVLPFIYIWVAEGIAWISVT